MINIITFTDSDREGYSYKVNEDQYIVTVEEFDPNGNFVNSTSVNKTSGEVTIKKADGQTKLSNLSNYVQFSASSNIPETILMGDPTIQGAASNKEITTDDVTIQDYVDNEPINDDGLQNSVYGDGYKFLGSRGVYYFDDLGYLFRKISSMTKGEAYQFTFTAGTSISTILAVLLAFSKEQLSQWQ